MSIIQYTLRMKTPLKIRLDKTAKAGELLKTKNCNLDCLWCHGDYFRHKVGAKAISNQKFIKIVDNVLAASSRQMAEIKISGQGEPCLVGERELCGLIKGLLSLPKVLNVKLVTNGILLDKMAKSLKDSGLDGVTVSIHSLKAERYKQITGKNKLSQALKGIRTAQKVGLKVKLNVIYSLINEDEIWDFINFSEKERVMIKFFSLLPINPLCNDLYLPLEKLLKELETKALSKKIIAKPYSLYEYCFSKGGITVQVKNSSKNNCPQKSCKHRKKCLEGCRSSVRISQDGILHPCGVRIDNVISLVDPNIGQQEIKKALLSGGKS